MPDFAAGIRRKVRRKRHPDDTEQTVPSSSTHTPQSQLLQLQSMVGNRNLQRMLAEGTAAAPIQRMLSYNKYKKSTSALGRRNHIKPLDKAYKAYMREQGGLDGHEKLARLKGLINLCDVYLADAKRQKSKRRDGVEDVKAELVEEIKAIKTDLGGGDFTEGNVADKKRNAVGGGMNRLDYIKYSFGVTQDVDDEGTTADKKVQGSEFEAYFKEQVDEDKRIGQTRGGWTGIPEVDPKFAERSVATYEISKLLDPSIIPPTFMAKHERDGKTVDGFVMGIAKGIGGDKKVETDDGAVSPAVAYKDDPVYRAAISKLMLLDFICGQVDRHPGNYIIQTGPDGKVKGVMGIDNDLAFGDKFTDTSYGGMDMAKGFMFQTYASAGGNVTELNEIDKKFAEKIVALSANNAKVRQALSSLLKPTEVDATISRLKSLSDFLQPLLNANSPRIKSEWK